MFNQVKFGTHMISSNLKLHEYLQVEVDIERHVLTQSKKLSDNSMEKIFTRNHRNESGMFTYNCHLCSVASLPGERSLQTHITGRKHQQRLSYDYVPNAEQFRTPLVPNIRRKILTKQCCEIIDFEISFSNRRSLPRRTSATRL